MRLALITAIFLTFLSTAFAAKSIEYGNRAGQAAHVVSTNDLSTAHAILQAKITRSDAVAFCREYVLKVTPGCIAETLSDQLDKPVTANCPARTFTDFSGDHWRFDGPRANDDGTAKAPPNDDGTPKFRLIHVETGEEVDGSMASNYGISLGIFRALCPKQAPPETEGY